MSNSLISDLSKRVRRFGKAPNSVPGTYMSAAGIQTEIHPTTLARLAVHETKYRRQVHVYRQDLASKVYQIRRDQRQLKKSVQEYRKKKKYNLTHRHVSTASIRDQNELIPPIQSTMCDKIEGVEQTVGTGALDDEGKDLLDDVKGKDLLDDVDSESHNITNGKMTTKQGSPKGTESNDTKSGGSDDDTTKLEHIKAKSESSQIKSQEMLLSSKSEGVNVLKTTSYECLPLRKNSVDNHLVSQSDVISPKSAPHYKHVYKDRADNTDTASFMELVRIKNKTGLSKNLKVIDKLINNSRNRHYAYFTPITTPTNHVITKQIPIDKHSKLTNGIDGTQKTANVSNGTNVPKAGRTRKIAVIEPPQIKQSSALEEKTAQEVNMMPSIVVKQPINQVFPSKRRLSIPAKHVDRFLHNEKLKNDNYKEDISWQESLASIRDVHYIRNQNDYEQYALNVLQETSYKPVS